jgi:hypothetical protein
MNETLRRLDLAITALRRIYPRCIVLPELERCQRILVILYRGIV